MVRVLVIEDDPDVREILRCGLAEAGDDVQTASTGLEGLRLARERVPDLVLLDLVLPDVEGTMVCKQLKLDAAMGATRVIIVSARGEEDDRITGFELGADDYVVKPFSLRELLLRVQAVMRGTRRLRPATVITCGALRFDQEAHRVWVDGNEVELSALEFRALVTLQSRQGRTQSRGQLASEAWGGSDVDARSVNDLIKRVRQKLGSAGKYIRTVHGVGYLFSPDPAKSDDEEEDEHDA